MISRVSCWILLETPFTTESADSFVWNNRDLYTRTYSRFECFDELASCNRVCANFKTSPQARRSTRVLSRNIPTCPLGSGWGFKCIGGDDFNVKKSSANWSKDLFASSTLGRRGGDTATGGWADTATPVARGWLSTATLATFASASGWSAII